MEKQSIWKRMGDWLRRSNTSRDSLEVVHHDAEGLVVPPPESANDDSSAALSPRHPKKELQLAALEESFNRLVDVLESLNQNVSQQTLHNKDLVEHLAQTGQTMQALPEHVETQGRSIQKLAQEIKDHTVRNQQVVEIVKTLPDLNRQQVDRLGDINRQMETSVENESRMVESFTHFDSAVQGMLSNTKAQTLSLANMGEMLEKNEQQVQNLIKHQSRRFTWLLVIIVVVFLAALGTLTALMLMSQNPPA